MCGRYSLGLPLSQIQALNGYDVHIGEWVNQQQFQPRFNIAPRTQAPVIRQRHAARAPTQDDTSNADAQNDVIMQTMKWGVVPHWSKHEENNLNTINARSEALIEGGGLWGGLRGRKRCAIPCDGYYEWLKKGKDRLPHFTKREDGKLMLLAGLYDVVTLEGQSTPLYTFSIVTTDADKEFNWLHDRQPVILSTTEALNQWLDTSSQQWTPELTKLLQPYSDTKSALTCYAVPKEVGKVGTESSTFIQPISERQDGIQAMFAKQMKGASQESSSPSKLKKRSLTPETLGSSSSPPRSQPSPSKRRKLKENTRSSGKTETIDLCEVDDDDADTNSTNKTEPVEKVDAWEDSTNIEYPGTPSKRKSPSHATESPTKTTKARQPKTPKKPDDGSSRKITSFFTKT